ATYFQDPETYERQLPDRMTPALMSTGEKHVAIHNSARAIECWTRVLAYAPEHPAVTAALRRWEGRDRRRAALRLSLIGAGLVTVLLIASRFLSRPSTDPPPAANPPSMTAGPPPASSSATTPATGPNAAPATVTARPPGEAGPHTRPAHLRGLAERPAESTVARPRLPADAPAANASPPAGSATQARTFALGPTPQNVDVYLDGERQFAYDTDHRTLSVAWNGTHQIEFRSPSGCCFVERVEIGPERPLPPDNVIARKLRWKPARIVVTTQPASTEARVMVRDPGRPGRGTVVIPGEEANIPFLPSDEAQKDIEISVDSAQGVFAQRVSVRAGERKSVVVPLGAALPVAP
ncbi:MAG TPA: hypothetical protein VHU40_01900, partial [Polyangia bacterium]|nr:hypothetical protein [Polyangia bacterium]